MSADTAATAFPWGTEVGIAFKKGRLGIAWQQKFLLLIETGTPRPGHPRWGFKGIDGVCTAGLGLGFLHITLAHGNLDFPWASDAAGVVVSPGRMIA